MSHPFQCLLYQILRKREDAGILIAACGNFIYTLNVDDGKLLSRWPAELERRVSRSTEEADERPQKRRKLSSAEDESGSSAEIVVKSAEYRDVEGQCLSNSAITKLVGTSNGQCIVAVTGEDKCIRVFEITAAGMLSPLSQRTMPKRSCAVALTPDESTILCGDKFGDVYSLPLMENTQNTWAKHIHGAGKTFKNASNHLTRPFVPAATTLTVHTKGNREALRQQQNIRKPKIENKFLDFEHRLLLGHLSLLTDICSVAVALDRDKSREYILTSDRDEHIRISRGIPQAHVIEGYCLGHTEFVSKICVLAADHRLLISGGGDDYLILWNWLSGSIKQKVDLRGPVESSLLASRPDDHGQASSQVTHLENGTQAICVSNIQIFESPGSHLEQSRTQIIVTCERIPAMFMFTLDESFVIKYNMTVNLDSNIIDLAIMKDRSIAVYSLDTVHRAFSSTSLINSDQQIAHPSVGAVSFDPSTMKWVQDSSLSPLISTMTKCPRELPSGLQKEVAKGKSLSELLYGLESLRKRGVETEENDADG